MYDMIIIGGGPAGLSAAVYGRRAGHSVLVLEKSAFGGQITGSPRVENFPGFKVISGAEIGDKLLEQALDHGAEAELEEVCSVEEHEGTFSLRCLSGAEFQSRSLIIASGARPRGLDLPREEELTGSGVCFCALCDGAFYKGQTVAVVGGGNSALQDALLLSESCEKVYLIHRRDSFRGEVHLVETLQARPNVELVLNARVKALLGRSELQGLVIDQAGTERELPVAGLFLAIGRRPDTDPFVGFIPLDQGGYAPAGEDCLGGRPGVFVAGDCRRKTVRQLATAVADGAVAAVAACEYLAGLK